VKFYARIPFDGQPATKLVRVSEPGAVPEYWLERDQSWVPRDMLAFELMMNPDYEPISEADVPRVMAEVARVQV